MLTKHVGQMFTIDCEYTLIPEAFNPTCIQKHAERCTHIEREVGGEELELIKREEVVYAREHRSGNQRFDSVPVFHVQSS